MPNGTCADSCTGVGSGAQCSGGDVCSAGGGCIAATDCGSDTDCNGNKVCGGTAKCIERCTATSCSGGTTCNSVGHCATPTTPGAPTGNPNTPSSCGGELFGATAVQANFLIVQDHSGSMADAVGGKSKWDSAVTAVKQITVANEVQIRFGLQMFSFSGTACNAGKIDVAIGDQHAGEIAAALPAVANGNKTPIGGALNVALANPGLVDANRSNNVLLITDGMENCGGNPVSVVEALFKKGIKTYVVGFGGEVDANMLSKMATAGGTARVGPVKYYQADDSASLDSALKGIARGAMGCDLKLAKAPADPSKLNVYVNGSLQNRDTQKQNGWDYNADGQRVVLYGAACVLVTNDANAKVQVVYGCPDGTLVEGGPGSACGAHEQCASGRCTAGLCEAPSGAKPGGAACGANSECASAQCTNGRCETPGGKPGGSTCTGNSECASGTCSNGLCEAPAGSLPTGSACSKPAECATGNCAGGTCQPAGLPGGAACGNNAQCISRNCNNGVCEGGGLPSGSPCSAPSQCASGVCASGICEPILG